MKITQARKQLLTRIYMRLFDDFNSVTKEVMRANKLSRPVALKALKQLQALGLITAYYLHRDGTLYHNDMEGRRMTVGMETIWQCLVTYDHDTEEQARARVQSALQ